MSDDYEDDFESDQPSKSSTTIPTKSSINKPSDANNNSCTLSQLNQKISDQQDEIEYLKIKLAAKPNFSSSNILNNNNTNNEKKIAELQAKIDQQERELTKQKSFTSTSLGRRSNNTATEEKTIMEIGNNRAREVNFTDLTLGEVISGGGFCLLYKGSWLGLTVAIKRIFDPVISNELKAEFENEVSMLSNLQHPHVVQILCAVSRPPSLCLVTEFMARGSLYHVLHESKLDMTKQRKLSVAIQAATAYSFIHSCAIVHRDIKSHNILADEHLKIKVCDFGMAKRLSTLRKEEVIDIAGTPNYMSPELFQKQPASFSSDVYAFGVLLAELWSREIPFDGFGPAEIKKKVLNGERPSIDSNGTLGKDCPPNYWNLVKECWHEKPEKRPTFEKILKTLQSISI